MDSTEKLISLLKRVDGLLCDIGNECEEMDVELRSVDYIPALRNDILKEIASLDDIIFISDKITSQMLFEGTIAQFKDCFFDNADIDTIKDWAESQGCKVIVKKASYIKPILDIP
jgi:uncharacterized protein Yka (UPF0111/DUF47 family)